MTQTSLYMQYYVTQTQKIINTVLEAEMKSAINIC